MSKQFVFATQVEKDTAIASQKELMGDFSTRLGELENASVDTTGAKAYAVAKEGFGSDNAGVLPESYSPNREVPSKKELK